MAIRLSKFKAAILVLFLFTSFGLAQANVADLKMREALLKALTELSKKTSIKPTEKKIFDTQVLPHANLFITNTDEVREQDAKPETDIEKLLAFLKFTSSGPHALVCVVVQFSEFDVETQVDQGSSSQDLWKHLQQPLAQEFSELLKKRGFATKILSRPPGLETECRGTLIAQVTPDKSGTEHDEYSTIPIQSSVILQLSDRNQKLVRVTSVLSEIMPKASESKSEIISSAQGLTFRQSFELFVQAFEQGMFSDSADVLSVKQENFLRLDGVTSFQRYIKAKTLILNGISGLKLEERLIRSGSVMFKILGLQSLGELSSSIRNLAWNSPIDVKREQIRLNPDDKEEPPAEIIVVTIR